ncbi:Uncharacterized protein BM_BM13171 [Brugia malayi]|uniref:Bm13171 n=1 Tax=Brugia malayi TaxID=6279 RepID=A0A0J9Y137_BRUMA|nr:Uncharacterized protein BM_BM13171 [Brugia malayi]CDQ00053.1 Bm13171 [Brugia malayi]VIO91523.1 Uncharacterized protein BM_BM13171 [Brugia malayi]
MLFSHRHCRTHVSCNLEIVDLKRSFFAASLKWSYILNVSFTNDFIFMNVPLGAVCGFVNSEIYLSLT